MIVLDTNVISEAMKPEPHPVVVAWLDQQAAETLYLSGVTLAELLFSIGTMPSGRRKRLSENSSHVEGAGPSPNRTGFFRIDRRFDFVILSGRRLAVRIKTQKNSVNTKQNQWVSF